ncbi:hypothetical protein [Acidocella sp.]
MHDLQIADPQGLGELFSSVTKARPLTRDDDRPGMNIGAKHLRRYME